jgi:hypothetical protein
LCDAPGLFLFGQRRSVPAAGGEEVHGSGVRV